MGVWQTIHKNERHKKRKLYLFPFYSLTTILPSNSRSPLVYGMAYADTHRDTNNDMRHSRGVRHFFRKGKDKKITCEIDLRANGWTAAVVVVAILEVRVAVKYMHIHYPYVF